MNRARVLGTALVMTGMLLSGMDFSIVGTAMPTIVGELGGIDRYAWVFSAFLLVSTATTPIFGRLADMYGRKPLYFGALVAFVVSSVLAGGSRTMDELIVFRALQGLGVGALIPIGITMIGDLYDSRSRAKVVGLFGSMWLLSAMLGPAIGAALTQTLSWRWCFYVNLPIGAVALVLLIFGFRDTGEHRRQRIDVVGFVVFVAAATSLMLGLHGVQPPLTIAVAVLLGVLFVRVERSAAAPMIDLALLRDPLIGAALAMTVAVGAVQFGLVSFVPPFVQGVLGGRPADAGIALAATSIGWSSGATGGGWVLFRVGLRRLVLLGTAALTAAALGLALLGAATPFAFVVVIAVVAGLGLGWTAMPVTVALQSAVGYARRGSVTSLLQFTRTLGGAAGVAAMGSILNARLGDAALGASVLLDPSARGVASGAALDQLAFALGEGLRGVYLATLGLGVLALALALRLPTDMPVEAADRAISPSSATPRTSAGST